MPSSRDLLLFIVLRRAATRRPDNGDLLRESEDTIREASTDSTGKKKTSALPSPFASPSPRRVYIYTDIVHGERCPASSVRDGGGRRGVKSDARSIILFLPVRRRVAPVVVGAGAPVSAARPLPGLFSVRRRVSPSLSLNVQPYLMFTTEANQIPAELCARARRCLIGEP